MKCYPLHFSTVPEFIVEFGRLVPVGTTGVDGLE